LLQLGIAIWTNGVWVVATLVVAIALIHFVVIQERMSLAPRSQARTQVMSQRAVLARHSI
jgi:hypothetical protein